jgi:S1-C subfamily serine protease
MKILCFIVALALVLIGFLNIPPSSPGPPDDRDCVPRYLQDITVHVISPGGYSTGIVTGSKKNTYVWTAAHCVRGQLFVGIQKTDKSNLILARIVATNENDDLAVLLLEEPGFFERFAVFANMPPELGETVWHSGNMLGKFSKSITKGTISHTNREWMGQTYYQTTAAIHKGSSGGGVFKQNGRCVGLVSKKIATGISLFTPINKVRLWAIQNNIPFKQTRKIVKLPRNP